jgi:hypothetical protein
VLFESPTVEQLAQRVETADIEQSSHLVPLRSGGSKNPVFCWPGLGGFTVNLRPPAGKANLNEPSRGSGAWRSRPGWDRRLDVRPPRVKNR